MNKNVDNGIILHSVTMDRQNIVTWRIFYTLYAPFNWQPSWITTNYTTHTYHNSSQYTRNGIS